MLIEMPAKFDTNEFLVLGVMLIVLTVCAFLPLRFSRSQMVYILMYNFFLGVVVDQILAVPPYDLYDIMDVPKMDVMDLIIYTWVYPFIMYLFAYLADWIGLRKRAAMVLLVAGCSAAILGVEWSTSQFGVYKYHGWRYSWSALAYVLIFTSNLLVLRWIVPYRK